MNVSPNQDGQGSSQQTDSSGHYITGALAPGDYAVSFSDSQSPTVWAPQSWNGQLPGVEDVLTLVPGDAPVRTGIAPPAGMEKALRTFADSTMS